MATATAVPITKHNKYSGILFTSKIVSNPPIGACKVIPKNPTKAPVTAAPTHNDGRIFFGLSATNGIAP